MGDPAQLFAVLVINTGLMALAVLIHYETLCWLAQMLPRVRVKPRTRVLLGVFGVLLAHIAEIWLFAFGYYGMLNIPGLGTLHSSTAGTPLVPTLLECSYFSFVTFTTVGYGDIVATGAIRYLTGIEALSGFVLITWSASFVFLEMQRYWPLNAPRH